jgi:hypothetical protein
MVLSQPLPGGTEGNHEALSQDSWYLTNGFNLVSPKYEEGVLSTQPSCLVSH